jgi:hypothetical protein
MTDKPSEEVLRTPHEREVANKIIWKPAAHPMWSPVQEPKTGSEPFVEWQPAKAPDYQWHEKQPSPEGPDE